MAMNKQRRTANLNNIVTYDTLKNVTLLADLTVEGLTGAGFVKADANGLLSVDTGAYLPIPSQTGNGGKYLTTDGVNLSWGTVSTANIYNSNGTLTAARTLSTGAFNLAVQWNSAFSSNSGTPTTNIFQVKSSTNENAISVWSNGGVGIGRNAGGASAVNGYALYVDNGNNTGIYTGSLYSVTAVSALNGNIVLGIYGSKSISFIDGAANGAVSYTNTDGLIVNSGQYAGVRYNTTVQVADGKGIRVFGPTGNVVIGGSAFTDAGYKLDVQGTGSFTGVLTIGATGASFDIAYVSGGQGNINLGGSIGGTSDRSLAVGGSANGLLSIAVGRSTTASNGGTAIGGYQTIAIGGVAIGAGVGAAYTNAIQGVAIGISSAYTDVGTAINGTIGASGSNSNGIAINGIVAGGFGNGSIALLGYAGANQSVAIYGYTSSPNEFVVGSAYSDGDMTNFAMTNVYFGSGKQRGATNGTNKTGAGISYTINGSGAFGTDFAGGNITIAGGKGTGTGTPGDVIISTATPTSTGTTLQTLTQRVWINGSTGNVFISTNGFNRTGASGAYSLAIGNSGFPAAAAGDNSVSIGTAASASGIDNIAIGTYATAAGNYSIAIGRGVTANNREFVVGQTQDAITSMIIGSSRDGRAGFAGNTLSIAPSPANGTNLAGGSTYIYAGRGTGTGTSGDIIFSTATPTSTGAVVQSLTDRVWIKGDNGNVGIGATPNASYKLDVSGTARITLPLQIDSRSIKTANTTAAYYFQGSALWLGNFSSTDATTGTPSFYDQYLNKIIIGNTSWATNVNSNIIAIGMNQTGQITTYGGILIGSNSALQNAGGYRHDLNIIIGHSSGIGFTGIFNTGKNIVIGNSSQTTPQPNANKLTIIGNDINSDLANAVILGETTQSIIIGAYAGLNSSAKVQIDSTTKGFLPPRMTTTQKTSISTPASGLVVYDTSTNFLSYYDGVTWVGVGGSTNIYTSDGILASDRYINGNSKNLWINDINTLRVATGLSGTNNVALFESIEPNINIKATGATNGAALFLSPSAGYNGAIHNRTGGGIDLYTGATPSISLAVKSSGAVVASSTLGMNGVEDSVKSGKYTPTLTNSTNVASSAVNSNVFKYIRVGSTVHVSGWLTITATTANSLTELELSLPIASNITSNEDVSGVANTLSGGYGQVRENATNNTAKMYVQPTSTGNLVWYLEFSYVII